MGRERGRGRRICKADFSLVYVAQGRVEKVYYILVYTGGEGRERMGRCLSSY